MRLSQSSRYFLYAFLVSVAIGILIHLDGFLEWLAPMDSSFTRRRSFENLMMVFTTSSMVAFGTFTINYFILKPLDTRKGYGIRRSVTAVIVTLLSVYILSDVFFGLVHVAEGGSFSLDFNLKYFLKDIIVSSIILGGLFSIKTIYDKQRIEVENEKLIRENLESRYEALKSQVSPHFLFNSLSALKTLIGEDPETARGYLDHMADVLRNTLQKRFDKTVTVEDELNLLNSYLFLIQMRFGEHLEVNISVNSSHFQQRLPHLSLQTLVENAVKHNVISHRHHLIIDIYAEGDGLVVRNTLNKKQTPEDGTGFGLPNLISQYKLMNGAELQISKTEKYFKVALPYINSPVNESSSR
jgi:hypothetical protein